MSISTAWYLVQSQRERKASAQQREALLLGRLQSIVTYAYEKSPFYREHFAKAQFHPDQLNTLEDMRRIPIVTKAELMAKADLALTSRLERQHHIIQTSGSMGDPMGFIYERHTIERNAAIYGRWMWSLGYRPSHRLQYHTAASCIARSFQHTAMTERWYHRAGLVQRDFVVASSREEQLQRMLAFKPDWLFGMPSVMTALARYLSDSGIVFPMKIRGLVTGGELLTSADRALLETTFGCPVYNRYVSTEFWGMAHECAHRQLHVEHEAVHLEVLAKGEPVFGTKGELVCTSLLHRAQPLIRYAIGDEAILQPDIGCACGCTAPALQELGGYRSAYKTLEAVWGNVVNIIERQYQSQRRIGAFQIQVDPMGEHARLVCEAAISTTPETLASLQADAQRAIGSCTVECTLVQHIEAGPGGKFTPFKVVAPFAAPRNILH